MFFKLLHVRALTRFLHAVFGCLLAQFHIFRALAPNFPHSQYSVVVPGVANAKIATLVSACAKKQGGISRATFVRMLRKVKTTGFLHVYKTYRSNGGFAHNVFVFHPIDVASETQLTYRDADETPSESNSQPSKSALETKNLFINLENKDLNIRHEKNVSITPHLSATSATPHLHDRDYTFVPDNVPHPFIQLVKPFFDRAEEIYTFWQKALMAYKKFNFRTPIEQLISIVVEAFKTTVFLYKKRKIKTSFTPYFYGTLSGMFSAEKRREQAANQTTPRYNWLEE
ncbi:hypothetical protein [Fictibacillus nanhaiensis]|uniref:hypothetical protein n=1 Tax=Fictibacillus nanhaiensis TaxID=742169 RepID=UPI003C151647